MRNIRCRSNYVENNWKINFLSLLTRVNFPDDELTFFVGKRFFSFEVMNGKLSQWTCDRFLPRRLQPGQKRNMNGILNSIWTDDGSSENFSHIRPKNSEKRDYKFDLELITSQLPTAEHFNFQGEGRGASSLKL